MDNFQEELLKNVKNAAFKTCSSEVFGGCLVAGSEWVELESLIPVPTAACLLPCRLKGKNIPFKTFYCGGQIIRRMKIHSDQQRTSVALLRIFLHSFYGE